MGALMPFWNEPIGFFLAIFFTSGNRELAERPKAEAALRSVRDTRAASFLSDIRERMPVSQRYFSSTRYSAVVPLTSLPTTSSASPFGDCSAGMNTRPSGPRSPTADSTGATSSVVQSLRLFR